MSRLALARVTVLRGLVSAVLVLGTIDVVVDVGVLVVIDVDIAAAPVAIAPGVAPGGADGDANAESNEGSAGGVAGGIVAVGGVGRVRPSAVDDGGIVRGDVNDLGVGRFNGDDLRGGLGVDGGSAGRGGRRRRGFDFDDLLVVGLEVSLVFGFGAEFLDGGEDAGLVVEEGVAKLDGGVEFFAHHGEDGGEVDERFDAGIPRLLFELLGEGVAGELGVGLGEAVGLDHFQRIGGGHEDLGDERIGIEGNGRDELFELGVRDGGVGRTRRSSCSGCGGLGEEGHRLGVHEEHDESEHFGLFAEHVGVSDCQGLRASWRWCRG